MMKREEGTLDDRYLEWLYKEIGAVSNRNPARSYWSLAKQLYTKPFDWTIPNDDNRVEDGRELRYEFLSEHEILEPEEHIWADMECSVLEMLIGLARRASFESTGEPGDWFWHFMGNLGLRGYTDDVYNSMVRLDVEESLDQLIERRYERNGNGGLFPLQNPRKDQRKVELWYQLSAYLLEGGYVL